MEQNPEKKYKGRIFQYQTIDNEFKFAVSESNQ